MHQTAKKIHSIKIKKFRLKHKILNAKIEIHVLSPENEYLSQILLMLISEH